MSYNLVPLSIISFCLFNFPYILNSLLLKKKEVVYSFFVYIGIDITYVFFAGFTVFLCGVNLVHILLI